MSDVVNAVRPTRDLLLEGLVKLTTLGGESTITILVGGTLISGRLVAAEVYAKHLSKELADGFKRAGAKSDSTKFDDAFAKITESDDLTFLHMIDLKRHAGTQFVTITGAMMRVRVADVAAWWLGVPA